jgi:serine/threonine protein kinase
LESLLEVVIFIHSEGYCHRGISPKSVYISGEQLKLDGFLMSKEDKQPLQVCPRRYVAPEVHMTLESSREVDIWGLGIVTFYMLFNVSPFGNEVDDPLEKFKQWNNLTGANLIIPPKNETVPPFIIEFLRKTIEKDLNQRWKWPNFVPFLKRLKEYLSTEQKKQISMGNSFSCISQPSIAQLVHHVSSSQNYNPSPIKSTIISEDSPSPIRDHKRIEPRKENSLKKNPLLSEDENDDNHGMNPNIANANPIKTNPTGFRFEESIDQNQNQERMKQVGISVSSSTKSRLAPIYRNHIFETATKIYKLCSGSSISDEENQSIEMVFRLLLMVAIKLYLLVLSELEKIPVAGIFDANKTISLSNSPSEGKDQVKALVLYWKENLAYLKSKSVQSSLGEPSEESDLKDQNKNQPEQQLRDWGKKYLRRLFSKYFNENDCFENTADEVIDAVKYAFAMLHVDFDIENHQFEDTQDETEKKIASAMKRALSELVPKTLIPKPKP